MSNATDERATDRLDELARITSLPELQAAARELHASDLADLFERLDEERRVSLLFMLPIDLASEALAEMDEDAGELLASLSPAKGAELLGELADDDAADLIGGLAPADQKRLLDEMPEADAGEIRGLLEFDEETAGGLMTTEFIAVEASLTAAEALQEVRVKGREVEDFYSVFVVDARSRLLGTLPLAQLVMADPADRVAQLVEPLVATVPASLDQEEVGRLIARYNLASIPVVDGMGRLLGRITFDDVIDVIEAEQTEDILRLAGVGDEEQLRHGWLDSVRVRLPWLLLNLLTAAGAASVILLFADTMAQIITLAFLAPIIAATSGSAGTQSLAVTIRRIAVEGRGAARGFVGKEILIGLVNGAAMGLGIAGVALLVGSDPMLGVVVFLAMWVNQIVACFAGAFIPTTLDKLGLDPSVASSVFICTLTDLCGFFLLLGLATKLLL